MKLLFIFNLQKLALTFKYLRMQLSNCGSLISHQKNLAD